MRLKATSDIWWKNAVVYCLDVEAVLDTTPTAAATPGLTERVDYLAGMGVSCLWLMPFYPSPRRDDGYDITDFYGIDGRLGTPGDFAELIRTASRPRHPGDRRPGRQPHLRRAPMVPAARATRDSPYHDFYVWAKRSRRRSRGDIVFPDKEESNWAVRPQGAAVVPAPLLLPPAGPQRRQPAVRDEIAQVVGYWLEQGLAGFRVDAVPFLLEPMGMPEGALAGSARAAARPAPLHGPAPRRRDPARRGEPAARGAARRSSATRTATSST